MNRKDSTFFMAFLWFLFLCILCKIASQFLHFPWADILDNLILAVSVSAFFFAASDICNAARRHDGAHQLFEDRASGYVLDYLDRCIKRLEDTEHMSAERQAALDVLKEDREKRAKEKERKSSGGKASGIAIFLDILGFFAFLVCLFFSPVSKALKPIQDILTLIAFFTMLYHSFVCAQFERATDEAVEEERISVLQIGGFCAPFLDGDSEAQDKETGEAETGACADETKDDAGAREDDADAPEDSGANE